MQQGARRQWSVHLQADTATAARRLPASRVASGPLCKPVREGIGR
jgi:hypothetical protein